MKKIKTAVVGIGHLGRHHLRWFSQLPDSELVGLYDTDGEKAAQYAKEYDTTAFKSLDELINAAEAVSIVTPTSTHFEVAAQIIEAGLHCLIEKPITAKIEDAEKLKVMADKAGVKVTVGQIERFNPAVIALKDYQINPSFIEAHRLAAFDPRGTDVAVVLDLMIHDIDLALHLIDSKISDIQSSAVAVISEQVDIANARLTFENGAVANLTSSRISLQAMRKLRIFQQSGYYSLDLAKKQADVYLLADPDEKAEGMRLPIGKSGRNLLYNKVGNSENDMLGMELESFLKAISGDTDVAVSITEGAEALRVAVEVDRIGRESIERMLKK